MSLQAPQNLQGTVVSDTEVALSWDSVAGADIYRVRGGPTTPITDKTFFNVTGLEPGTTYEFTIVAEGLGGAQLESVFSPPSDPVTLTTLDAGDSGDVPGSLAAPGIISAEQTGVDEATITWGAVTDATGYEVRVDGGAEQDVGNALGYTETGLALGDYDFEVRAYAGDGPDVFSAWSTAVTVTISGLVAPDPTATVLSSGAIEVTWPAMPPADRYQVRIDNDKVFSAGSLTEYIDSGLAPVTTRSYEVRGLVDGTALVGPWSAPIEATTNRSSVIEIIGRLRRLSAYLSDRHITARSLNAEFNNIYALLNGGTLTEQGPAEAEGQEPAPAPPPEPDPDAQISVSPSSLSFAETVVDNSSTSRVVTVTNPGSVDLDVGNLSVTGDFRLASDACSNTTLAPGDTCDAAIQFRPTATGLRIGELTIPSSAPGTEDVALSGTGAATDDETDPLPPPDEPDPEVTTASAVTKTQNSTLHTITLPASSSGDLLVVLSLTNRFSLSSDPPLPAGWEFVGGSQVLGAQQFSIFAHARIADGGEGSSVDYSVPSPSDGLAAAFVVPRSPGSSIVSVSGGGSSLRFDWPTIGVVGPSSSDISRVEDDSVVGGPAFMLSYIAMVGNLEDGSDPGTIVSHNFSATSVPRLIKQNNAGDWFGAMDSALTFSFGVGEESFVERAGGGVLTYSNADYEHTQTVRTVLIRLS